MSGNTSGSHADFDLHGFVGVRVVDPGPGDVETVTRQLGPLARPLDREPDITVRFVDELPDAGPLTYAGWPESAGNGTDFFVLRGKDGVAARAVLPVQDVGGRLEILCERRAGHVPHLLAVINMAALRRGVLPLHASAFTYRGVGVLATGWAKGGKTETLLAFMSRGARYVGDEWLYLSADGRQMHGIPEPIKVWDWHLDQLPEYRALLGAGERGRLVVGRGAIRALSAAVPRRGRGPLPFRAMARALPFLQQQQYAHLKPHRIFPEEAFQLSGPVDRILLVVSHDSPEITVEQIDGEEIARRMVFSLQHERLDFASYYLKFRFAFPHADNQLIDQAEELQRAALGRALAGREACVVYHPYPVAIAQLFDAIRPLLS